MGISRGRLVIMGSGETAPTMIKIHRRVMEAVEQGPRLLLDTPYGFQENADGLSRSAVGYFRDSVGASVDVVSWRHPPSTALEREQKASLLRTAAWLFAGPGSPTYALRQWRGSAIPTIVAENLRSGGTVLFASAAAATLGSHAVPVYEIYKAGVDPYWEPGLDVVRAVTGLPLVVIPHYNNAEGGTHDTRFCYLGERRLAALERQLPDDAMILGVDEHTACVFDLDRRTMTVLGNGQVTVRRAGVSNAFLPDGEVRWSELGESAEAVADQGGGAPTREPQPQAGEPLSLRAVASGIATRFEAAWQRQDVDACVGSLLDLEESIAAWAHDTDLTDHTELARMDLRSGLVRLGSLAELGTVDMRSVLAPFVHLALESRAKARVLGDYAESDRIRDVLTAAGIDVRDTPSGPAWDLRAWRKL